MADSKAKKKLSTKPAAKSAPKGGCGSGDDVLYASIGGPFYVNDSSRWVANRNDLVVTHDEVVAPSFEDALLLPPRRLLGDDVQRDGIYEGGVCAADGSYVAAHVRSLSQKHANLSCADPYEVDEAVVKRRDEDVIFGGFIYSHFGHQLLESTSRLWYAVDHPEDQRKIVFLRIPAKAAKYASGNFQQFLDLAGLPASRVEVVDRPTRFARLTVPDQAFVIMSGADTRCLDVFRAMRERAQGPTFEKVYLSRSKFGRKDCVNEAFLEDFHRARGYEIVYPETLSLEEQVSVVAHAKELATTIGTMSHLFIFAEPDAKLTIFLRSKSVIKGQLLVDKVAGREPSYVYAARNILPTSHLTNAHLFGPTCYFRKYLLDEGIAFTEEELQGYGPTDTDFCDYLRRYDHVSQEERIRREEAHWDMSDVLAALHEGMNDDPATKGDYAAASIVKAKEKAADPDGIEIRAPRFELSWCKYLGDRSMTIHFKSDAVTPDFEGEIMMVADRTRERRAIAQWDFAVRDDGTVSVTLGLGGFFDGLKGNEECRRWDLFVAAPGVFEQLECEVGTRHFTSFSNFFLCEDGKLLVPHVRDNEFLCFWYLGEQSSDFSEDFFRYRQDRPLLDSLLVEVIRAERWDLVLLLYEDFRKGNLACEPVDGKHVEYRGESFAVGQFAYKEAQLSLARAQLSATKRELRLAQASPARKLARRVAQTSWGSRLAETKLAKRIFKREPAQVDP